MAASITTNPGVLVYPAGQRLIYSLATSTTMGPDYRFVVQVMEFNTTEIGKFYLTPNTSNKAFFDLAQVIEGRVKRDVVDNSNQALWDEISRFSQSPKNSKGYQIRVGEYNNGTETLNQANANIYLVDGYEQQRAGLHPGFSSYYPIASTDKAWMTEKEPVSNVITYKMATEDSACFAFLFNDITGGAVRFLQQRVYNASGIVGTAFSTSVGTAAGGLDPASTSPFIAGGTLLYANVGPANFFAQTTAVADWTKLEIDLRNGGGVVVSNTLRIERDCRPYKTTPTQMAFSNSVGGYDYIRWDGRRVESLTASDKSYRPLQGTWGAATFTIEPTGSDTEVFQKNVRQRYILNSLMTSSDFPLLGSAMKSRQVFIKVDGYWLPCTINEKSVNLQVEPMSKQTAVTLTAEISQDVRC